MLVLKIFIPHKMVETNDKKITMCIRQRTETDKMDTTFKQVELFSLQHNTSINTYALIYLVQKLCLRSILQQTTVPHRYR